MRNFTIVPRVLSIRPADITASDETGVLNAVRGLACHAASVFEDGAYKFSVRLDDKGVWCISQRSRPNLVAVSAEA